MTQFAWLRLNRSDSDTIGNIGGWLTTVVGRVCVDKLRARQARRQDYVCSWLPEPIVSLEPDGDPENAAVLADSIGLALLGVLEHLTPAERLAFGLHDMFGVPFDELAPIVGRTPSATRKLASRARRRVRGLAPTPDPDILGQREPDPRWSTEPPGSSSAPAHSRAQSSASPSLLDASQRSTS